LGYGISGDASIFQLGSVYTRPITENEVISLVVEANIWVGEGHNNTSNYSYYYEYDDKISFSGVNIPVLFKLDKSVFFAETGVFLDILSGKNERTSKDVWVTNVGVVLGGGVAFSKGYTHYFYRFNYGTAYYSHVFGIRMLF